jgi:hypothetical protein
MSRHPVVSSFVLAFTAVAAILLSGTSPAHHNRAPFVMDALLAFGRYRNHRRECDPEIARRYLE